VHVGTLTGTALYTQVSSALDKIWPIPSNGAFTGCTPDSGIIGGISYVEEDVLVKGGSSSSVLAAANTTIRISETRSLRQQPLPCSRPPLGRTATRQHTMSSSLNARWGHGGYPACSAETAHTPNKNSARGATQLVSIQPPRPSFYSCLCTCFCRPN
jgi:hypothetical protein